MGYGKGMGFGGLAEQNKPNKTEPGKTPNKDTKMLVADTRCRPLFPLLKLN